MAIIKEIYCVQCHKDKMVTRGSGDHSQICHDCETLNNQQKERMHFAALKGLTLEERVAKIEQWIYNQDNTKAWDGRY